MKNILRLRRGYILSTSVLDIQANKHVAVYQYNVYFILKNNTKSYNKYKLDISVIPDEQYFDIIHLSSWHGFSGTVIPPANLFYSQEEYYISLYIYHICLSIL